jgi:urease accessory protein
MTLSRFRPLLPGLLVLPVLFGAAPAMAHHLMGLFHLQPTPLSGLLSGLMHPLLGPDHLLFLLAIGAASVGRSHPVVWALGLLATGLLGSALGLAMPGAPLLEVWVALSLVLLGFVIAGRCPALLLLPAIAVHGYALSGSVIGWEPTPVSFYLVGLLISQGLLLGLSLGLLRRWSEAPGSGRSVLLSGVLIGSGLAFAWSSLVP